MKLLKIKNETWKLLLPGMFLMLSLTACGGGGGSSSGSSSSPPAEGTKNILNGTFTGGNAAVVTITAYDVNGFENTGLVYRKFNSDDCTNSWYPQGSLCDETPDTDSKTLSTKSNSDSGATWYNSTQDTTGVLIIDACSTGKCTTVSFVRARIFQMFSDGKTTQIRISVHPSTNTIPAWNDPGWVVVGNDFATVGAGTQTGSASVGDPTVIDLGSQTSRYIRVEVRNDGTDGDKNYIELRSIKLF